MPQGVALYLGAVLGAGLLLDSRRVPRAAVIVVGGWALGCLAISYAAGWDAQTLLVIPDSLVIIVYLSATLAAVRLLRGRRAGPARWPP